MKNHLSQSPRGEESIPANVSIFYTHQDKIYPWVKVFFGDDDPRNTPVQIQSSDEDAPIRRDWLGDLGILYVADMGDTFQVLLERDLPEDVTRKELHQLAVDNLSRDIEFRLHETTFGGYGLIEGGDHEAGSICIPGIWDWLTDHLNDNLIIAVPAKDLVLMVPEYDSDKVANLKIFVHEIFKDGERLLTKNIFRFDRATREWFIIDTIK